MTTTGRHSYRDLAALPAFLLYDGEKIVASVRAKDPAEARWLFRYAGLTGTHMRYSESDRIPRRKVFT